MPTIKIEYGNRISLNFVRRGIIPAGLYQQSKTKDIRVKYSGGTTFTRVQQIYVDGKPTLGAREQGFIAEKGTPLSTRSAGVRQKSRITKGMPEGPVYPESLPGYQKPAFEEPKYPYQRPEPEPSPVISSRAGGGLTAAEIFGVARSREQEVGQVVGGGPVLIPGKEVIGPEGEPEQEYLFGGGISPGVTRIGGAARIDYGESYPVGLYQPGRTMADQFIFSGPGEGLTAEEILAVEKAKGTGRKTIGEAALAGVPAYGKRIESAKTIVEYQFVPSATPGVELYGVKDYKRPKLIEPLFTKERGLKLLVETGALSLAPLSPFGFAIAGAVKGPETYIETVSALESRYVSPVIGYLTRAKERKAELAKLEAVKFPSALQTIEKGQRKFEIFLGEEFVEKPVTVGVPSFLTAKYVSIGLASFEEAGLTLGKLPLLSKVPKVAKAAPLVIGGATFVGFESYAIATSPEPLRRAAKSFGILVAFSVGASAAQEALIPELEEAAVSRAYTETLLPLSPRQLPTEIPGIRPRVTFVEKPPAVSLFKAQASDVLFLERQVGLLGRYKTELPFKYDVVTEPKGFDLTPRAYAAPEVIFDFGVLPLPRQFPSAPKTFKMPFELGSPEVQAILQEPKSSLLVLGEIKSKIDLRTRSYFGTGKDFLIEADTKSIVGDILSGKAGGLKGVSRTEIKVSRLYEGKPPEFVYSETLPSEFEVLPEDFGQAFRITTETKAGEYLGVGRRALKPGGGVISFEGGPFQTRRFSSLALEYGGKQEATLLEGKVRELRIAETLVSKEGGIILPGYQRAYYSEVGGALPKRTLVKKGVLDVGLKQELEAFSYSKVKPPIPEGTLEFGTPEIPFQRLIKSKRGELWPGQTVLEQEVKLIPLERPVRPVRPVKLFEGEQPFQIASFTAEEAGAAGVLAAPSIKLFPVSISRAKPSSLPKEELGLVPVSQPIQAPGQVPSLIPLNVPIQVPIQVPTQIPILIPSQVPIQVPIQVPTQIPILIPSQVPIQVPIQVPSLIPPAETPPKIPFEFFMPEFGAIPPKKKFPGFESPELKEIGIDVIPLSDLLSVNITEIFKKGGKATQPAITPTEKLEFDIGVKTGRLIFPTVEQRKGIVPLGIDVFGTPKKKKKRKGIFDLIPKIEVL